MSGQPQPLRLLQAFGINAISADITLPIPQPSQLTINPGAASLNDGFPFSCFEDPATGGVLPSGKDFNGILNMATAPVAYLMAGQLPLFDATLAAFMGGYASGATIAGAVVGATWTAIDDALTNNPDVDPTGWRNNTSLLHFVSSDTTGTYTNVTIPSYSDFIWDFDTTTGDIIINGVEPEFDGQSATFANVGTGINNLKLGANVGAPAAQIRMNTTLTIGPGDSATIRWSGALSKWILL